MEAFKWSNVMIWVRLQKPCGRGMDWRIGEWRWGAEGGDCHISLGKRESGWEPGGGRGLEK